jgi:hypothetical protein
LLFKCDLLSDADVGVTKVKDRRKDVIAFEIVSPSPAPGVVDHVKNALDQRSD